MGENTIHLQSEEMQIAAQDCCNISSEMEMIRSEVESKSLELMNGWLGTAKENYVLTEEIILNCSSDMSERFLDLFLTISQIIVGRENVDEEAANAVKGE